MKRLSLVLVMVGCGLSEERYLELRSKEECRIFGPDCIRAYPSVEECAGDEPGDTALDSVGLFDPLLARECIEELKGLCPAHSSEFNVPSVCHEVYSSEG